MMDAISFRKSFNAQVSQKKRESGLEAHFIRRIMIMDVFLRRFGLVEVSAKKKGDFSVVLKGGLALVKRYGLALGSRMTKDIDLLVRQENTLQKAYLDKNGHIIESIALNIVSACCQVNAEDNFVFEITDTRPLKSPTDGGWRFNIRASFEDGKMCDQFHIDLAFGDYLDEVVEAVQAGDLTEISGISSVEVAQISEVQQLCEKLHALCRDYEGEMNPRMRDIVDSVVIIRSGQIEAKDCAPVLKRLFSHRLSYSGYDIPTEMPPLHPDCEKFYNKEASKSNLDLELRAALSIISNYFEEIKRFY